MLARTNWWPSYNPHTNTAVVADLIGKVDIQAIDTTCRSWSKLKHVSIDFKNFQVDEAFAKCIRAGDDLLLTSQERSASGHDIGEVESVNKLNGTITLKNSITRNGGFATEAGPGESELAIEVAGLRRDVVFEAQNDDPNTNHGGHFIVFHTSGIVQTISGVLFKNFGQDGKIGKFDVWAPMIQVPILHRWHT